MKALAGSNWGFTIKTLVATYKAIVRPILNYALPSGSPKCPHHTWANLRWSSPEQGFEDRDRSPSTGRGVPPQSRDWGHPLKCSLRTVFSTVLCPRPSTVPFQSSYRYLSSRPPLPLDYPPGLISPYPKRPASKKWRPHLWWRAGGGRLPLSQTPPTRPDDRGDRLVSGTQ